MKNIAIITGDIVQSRQLSANQKKKIIQRLKKAFISFSSQFQDQPISDLEFFRGDSFQAIIQNPSYSLRISILLRALLQSETPLSVQKSKKNWDCRIGIGIGTMDFRSKDTITSDGQAFVYSGQAIDLLKNKSQRLQIKCDNDSIDKQMELFMRFAETIIGKWTINQAEVACLYLSGLKKTQTVIADELKISQSALNRRFNAGHIEEIRLLCEYFETLVF